MVLGMVIRGSRVRADIPSGMSARTRRSYEQMKIAHPHQSVLGALDVCAVIGSTIDVQVSIGGRRPAPGIVHKDHGGAMGATAPFPCSRKVV